MSNKNLPTIQDLYSELDLLSKSNDLNILLNQDPKKEWIKSHPMNAKLKYLPIERVEWLLTNLFVRWKVEVKDYKLIANSVTVDVRVHYLDPITNTWEWQDGVGASPLQTDKEAGATDWTKIKSDAVMKALPAAKTFAVKDAVEQIGKIFGKDLNRADQIMYNTLAGKFDDRNALDELKIVLSEFDNKKELEAKQVKLAHKYEELGVSSARQLIKKRLGELQ